MARRSEPCERSPVLYSSPPPSVCLSDVFSVRLLPPRLGLHRPRAFADSSSCHPSYPPPRPVDRVVIFGSLRNGDLPWQSLSRRWLCTALHWSPKCDLSSLVWNPYLTALISVAAPDSGTRLFCAIIYSGPFLVRDHSSVTHTEPLCGTKSHGLPT